MCDLECGNGNCYYGQPIRQQLAYLQQSEYRHDDSWLASFREFLLNTELSMKQSNCDHLLAKLALKQAWIEYRKALQDK